MNGQKVIFSCKDCTKRFVGCHSTCEEYNAQRNTYIEQRDAIRAEKALSYAIDEPAIIKAAKRKKRLQK